MKIKKLLIVFFLLLSFVGISQNSRTIKGKVLSKEDGSPLPGATIILKGTGKGAVTDFEGKFTYLIKDADINNVVLVVSFIGFKSQSVTIKDRSEFKFYLEPDVSTIDEVVITSSYGTQKLKQEVVGSISTIKPQDVILEQSVASFDELLEGQTAGVLIETSEEVGKPVNIHIRGQGSLTPLNGNAVGTSTQPLIIVDGIILAEEVALEGSEFFDGDGGKFSQEMLNPLAKIGITDIASINVLKDAAAVSLYGADGANGVIIITTKGGEKGTLKVNFSAQGGVSASMNRIKYMNGEQYREIRNLFYTNSGKPENVQTWNGVNTDWYDLLNRVGSFQRYNLSVSGGSDLINYRAGLSYQHIKEPQLNNNFTKYNTNVSIGFSKAKFKASLKLSPSFTVKNSPNSLYSFAVPPDISPYDEEGNYTKFDTYGNPLAVAGQNRALTETMSLLNSINASFDITDDLQISTLFGLDFSNKDQDTFYSGLNQSGIDNNGNIGERVLRERDTRRWNWNAKAFYKKTFNEDHYVDLLTGLETRQNKVDYTYARGDNFAIYDSPQPIADAENQDYRSDASETTGRSFFSQANYDYKKKYFFLINYRIDQSSVFGNDNNTSFNGGVGFSWVISKETFMVNPYWLDFLRLRASYGTSGNSRIGSYSALGLYSLSSSATGYNQDYYATPSSAPNLNLGWEKNYKFNIGLDISTTYRFNASVEYFNDKISDMIVSRDVLPETGYASVQINGADMYNRGIELGLTAHWIAKENLKWITNFNISKIINEVTHLEGLGSEYSASSVARAQKLGYPTSLIWGYEFVGIDPATGRDLFRIDGKIYDANTVKDNFNDNSYWVPLGNSQPDFFGGMNNKFTIYKNITVAINMSYSYGAERLVQKDLLDHYNSISTRNMTANVYYNCWRNPGDIALYSAVTNSNPLFSNSSKYLYNTSHIKLNSINVSYNLSLKGNRFKVKRLKIFINGSNLYYWYFDKSPENANGIKELRKIYPEMRTFSFGINANF